MAANTVSTSAPFTPIVLRGGDKASLAIPACQPCWFIYEPSCAEPQHGAKTHRRRLERERRNGGALSLDAAYSEVGDGMFRASPLTRGPWHPDHQHAGPPSALICRAIEHVAAKDGLTHLARLTVNLLRPAPIDECRVDVAADYVGRNAGHFSGRLTAPGQGRRAFHGAHAARGGFARSRRHSGPSAAGRRRSRPTNARSSRSLWRS